MIPVRISIEGFLSYKNECVFLFDGQPLWVLAGPNGAGKSAVFDAISFALYNFHRGGSKDFRNLVNHWCEKAVIEFDFEMSNRNYRIRRTIDKSNSSSTYQAYIQKADVWTPVANTDRQDGFNAWRENLLSLSLNAFRASIMLRQGESDTILKAKPRDCREILSSLIELDRYQALHDLAKNRHKTFVDKQNDVESRLRTINSEDISLQVLLELEETVKLTGHQYQTIAEEIVKTEQLIEQAKTWKRLVGESAKLGTIITELDDVISNEAEIEEAWREWNELKYMLPTLKQVLRQRLNLTKTLEELTLNIQNMSIQYVHTEIHESLSTVVDNEALDLDLAHLVINSQSDIEDWFKRKVVSIREIQLALSHLQSISKIHPAMRNVVINLQEVQKKQEDARSEGEILSNRLSQLDGEHEKITKNLDEAKDVVARFQQSYEDAIRQQKEFGEVIGN